MNTDFPRILTLLRKERGISQKQAAAELGISDVYKRQLPSFQKDFHG